MAEQLMTPADGPVTDSISYEDFLKWKNRIQSEVPNKAEQTGYINALQDIVEADVPTETLSDILKPVYNEQAQQPRGRPDVAQMEALSSPGGPKYSPPMEPSEDLPGGQSNQLNITGPLSAENLMKTPKQFGLRPADSADTAETKLSDYGPYSEGYKAPSDILNIEGALSPENLMKTPEQFSLARPADQAGDVVVPGTPEGGEATGKDLVSHLPDDWTKYVGLGALALFPAIVARMTGGDKETMMRAYAGGGKGLEEYGRQWLDMKKQKPDIVDVGGVAHQIKYDESGSPVLIPVPGAKVAAEEAQGRKLAGEQALLETKGEQEGKLLEKRGEIDKQLEKMRGMRDVEKAQAAGAIDKELKQLQIDADKIDSEAKRAASERDAEREAELQRQKEANALRKAELEAQSDFLKNQDDNAYKTRMADIAKQNADSLAALRKAQAVKAVRAPIKAGEKPVKITPAQNKAAGFAKMAESSNEAINKIRNEGFKKETLKMSALSSAPGWVANNMPGVNKKELDLIRRNDQAERNFVMSVLRPESGAALPIEEIESDRKRYFPVYGDSPEAIKQKEETRRLKIESLKAEAGPAYDAISKIPDVKLKSAPTKEDLVRLQPGQKLITPDGSEVMKDTNGKIIRIK
jgi:hypothetical protein